MAPFLVPVLVTTPILSLSSPLLSPFQPSDEIATMGASNLVHCQKEKEEGAERELAARIMEKPLALPMLRTTLFLPRMGGIVVWVLGIVFSAQV